MSRQAMGLTRPPIQWVPDSFPPPPGRRWEKRLGRDFVLSPPSSAQIKDNNNNNNIY